MLVEYGDGRMRYVDRLVRLYRLLRRIPGSANDHGDHGRNRKTSAIQGEGHVTFDVHGIIGENPRRRTRTAIPSGWAGDAISKNVSVGLLLLHPLSREALKPGSAAHATSAMTAPTSCWRT